MPRGGPTSDHERLAQDAPVAMPLIDDAAGDAATSDRLPPLVVDVDGSLVSGDLLIEGVARMLAVSPLKLPALPVWLAGGRAAFKRRVARAAALPPETLALNRAVLDEIASAKAQGREVWLASAADETVVAPLAERVGAAGFLASDGRTNLAGAAKARALVERFGEGGFDYVGNERRDLAVWRRARRIVGVGLPARLAREVRALDPEARLLPGASGAPRDVLRALRPHQWVKNVLVFVPLVAAHETAVEPYLVMAGVFAVLCAVASGTYLVNDLLDLPHRGPTRDRRAAHGSTATGAYADNTRRTSSASTDRARAISSALWPRPWSRRIARASSSSFSRRSCSSPLLPARRAPSPLALVLLLPTLVLRALRQQNRVLEQQILTVHVAAHLLLRHRTLQLPQHEAPPRRILPLLDPQHMVVTPRHRAPLVEDRQESRQLVLAVPAQSRNLHDVRAVVDPLHERMTGVEHPPGATLRHPRAHVEHRLVRQPQVVAQQVDGHQRHRLGAPAPVGDDVAPARVLLAQVAPEALHHRRRLRLPDLDEHLPGTPVGGAHPGREVHAKQRQRGRRIGRDAPVTRGRHLLGAHRERLHVELGDLADEQPRGLLVVEEVLEDRVVDGVGDFHAVHSTPRPFVAQCERAAWRPSGAQAYTRRARSRPTHLAGVGMLGQSIGRWRLPAEQRAVPGRSRHPPEPAVLATARRRVMRAVRQMPTVPRSHRHCQPAQKVGATAVVKFTCTPVSSSIDPVNSA